MSRRDDGITLDQILEHATEAVMLANSVTADQFAHDRIMQLALTRLVEIIGEASNRLSDSFRSANSQIPWLEIISMRNKLIHAYDAVDVEILWLTVTGDLPELIEAIKKVKDGR